MRHIHRVMLWPGGSRGRIASASERGVDATYRFSLLARPNRCNCSAETRTLRYALARARTLTANLVQIASSLPALSGTAGFLLERLTEIRAVAEPQLRSARVERCFERSYASLDELFQFLDRGLEEGEVSDTDRFALRLALEELFTNMVKYSSSKTSSISVRLDVRNGTFMMVLTDFDADPFDPTAHPAPDIQAPLSERRAGGLGLHLARTMVDSIDHEYADRKNIITLRKTVGK